MMSPNWIHPLLAVNEDAQTLIDLLITVIFIVIWLAGSIIRANTNKPSARRGSTTSKAPKTDSSPSTRSTLAASRSSLARWEELANRIEAEEQRLQHQTKISDVETLTSMATEKEEEPVLTAGQRQAWDQTMEISLDSPSGPIAPDDEDSLKSLGHIDGLTQARLTGVGRFMLDMEAAEREDPLAINLPAQWDRDQLAQAILSLEILAEPLALRDEPQARFMD